MSRRSEYLVLLGLLLFLGATNLWMSWENAKAYLFLSDVADYEKIATAAPGFPAAEEIIPFHKSQRFFVPYVLGLAARATGIEHYYWFMGLSLSCILLLFFGTHALLVRIGIPSRNRVAALGLLALQPYFFRYYGIALGMSLDLLFMTGSLIVLMGLFRRSIGFLVFGMAVAITARQTALLLLPGVALFLWLDQQWIVSLRIKALYVGALGVLCTIVYILGGKLASSFAAPNANESTLLGLFHWLLKENPTPAVFLEHALRCVLPFFTVLGLLLLEARESRRSWGLILMGIAVASQPFLGGPLVTGKNATRLVTLGLLPMVLAWVIARKREMSAQTLAWILFLAVIGSFHQKFSWIGFESLVLYTLIQFAVAVGIFAVVFRERRLNII